MATQHPDLRYRQIHLDFHTSEHIGGVGARFDPADFVARLQDAAVNSVTLFARCHHGWCYYPTNIGKPHPQLERPDLLGDMMSACRAADIATPVYLSVQWDEVMAREHPEWRVMQAENRAPNYPGTEPSAMNQLTPTWHTLCLNHDGYVDYVIDLALEVAERYRPPGFFMDILGSHECTCNACLERMTADGLDPLSPDDRKENDRRMLMRFFERFTGTINAAYPDISVFYNSGHIYKGERDRYRHYGHLELESLPTGGWGYDHFPVSARYADTLGMPYLGLTGRFHSHWGEFGGYKRPQALEFECCQMVALGARCSIGDQLHPDGHMNAATYDVIRPAYERIRKLEPFVKGAVCMADVAILSVEAQAIAGDWSQGRNHESDDAAAAMLLELQVPFDVIDNEADFDNYAVLVLPDEVVLDDELAEKTRRYVERGGAVIATGKSGLKAGSGEMALDIGARATGERIAFDPSYLRPTAAIDPDLIDEPIVMYEPALVLEPTTGETLAEIVPSYFNRTWDRFCSHLHTPEDTTAEPLGPAVVENGRVIYVAYPLFRLYERLGQPLYKYLFRGLLDRLLPERLVRTSLPSAGRISLTEQKEQQRRIVHLLYAPAQLRGRGITYNDGENRALEIIEDVPELAGVTATVRVDSEPVSVRCAYSGEDLPWSFDADTGVTLTMPRMHIHAAAVIGFGE